MIIFDKKIFNKKLITVLLFVCLIPQIMCVAMRFAEANILLSSASYPTLLDFAVSLFGAIATYGLMSALVYLTFTFDVKQNTTMWIICESIIFFAVVFIASYSPNTLAGLILVLISAVALSTVLISKTKNFRFASVFAVILTALVYVSGLVLYLISDQYESSYLAANCVYGLTNFGVDITVYSVSVCITSVWRSVCVKKNKNTSVNGKVLPHKSPVLLCMLIVNIVYTLVASISVISDTVSSVETYGPPVNSAEWAETLSPYLSLLLFFIVGYLISVIVINKLEDVYKKSHTEITKGE